MRRSAVIVSRMRWDSLFDDLESQLERERTAEELDLEAEEERLRLGRLAVRDRLLALARAPGERPVRLVLASEQDAKVDILHACGGNARCTTCRVEVIDGEPAKHTAAEQERLTARGLTGVRLSCQILCDHDMTVRAISRLAGSGRKDAGPRPADAIP